MSVVLWTRSSQSSVEPSWQHFQYQHSLRLDSLNVRQGSEDDETDDTDSDYLSTTASICDSAEGSVFGAANLGCGDLEAYLFGGNSPEFGDVLMADEGSDDPQTQSQSTPSKRRSQRLEKKQEKTLLDSPTAAEESRSKRRISRAKNSNCDSAKRGRLVDTPTPSRSSYSEDRKVSESVSVSSAQDSEDKEDATSTCSSDSNQSAIIMVPTGKKRTSLSSRISLTISSWPFEFRSGFILSVSRK